MKIETIEGFSSSGNLFKEKIVVDKSMDEVIRIHRIFFEKPPKKQKAVLKLLISWAIKHYFKIMFK